MTKLNIAILSLSCSLCPHAWRSLFRPHCKSYSSTSGSRVSRALAGLQVNKDWLQYVRSYPLNSDSCHQVKDKVLPCPNRKAPSVTKILSHTQSPESLHALRLWKKREIEKRGKEGFYAYQQEMLSKGSKIHSAIEQCLRTSSLQSLDPDEAIAGYWSSVSPMLADFKKVMILEKYLLHNELHYGGAIDCVAEHEDKLCVIDWKTSQRKKTTIEHVYDHPVQIAAYVGLWNACHPAQQIDSGMLVMMYENGDPCDIIKVDGCDLSDAWNEWTSRIHTYWLEKYESRPLW